MKLPEKRQSNLIGSIACGGLMAYALYAQYQLLLEPCPLCVFQRMAVIGMGIFFLIAAIHSPNSWGSRVYAFLIGLFATAGSGVAARHVWLQHFSLDEALSCNPGFSYMIESFPLGKALDMIFKGSGECTDIDWWFLGLSMPVWTFLCIVMLGAFGIWTNLRRNQTR
jgi:disulfide bond formation protein DsbB